MYKKVNDANLSATTISEMDILELESWDLPGKWANMKTFDPILSEISTVTW